MKSTKFITELRARGLQITEKEAEHHSRINSKTIKIFRAMKQKKDRSIYFKRGDKVRIINLNKEGIIISIAYISYESLSYNVEVCGSTVVVNINNLEKI